MAARVLSPLAPGWWQQLPSTLQFAARMERLKPLILKHTLDGTLLACLAMSEQREDDMREPATVTGLDQAIGRRERVEVYRRYAPAYSYGWREHLRRGSSRFEDHEADLAAGWRFVVNEAGLSWDEVRGAVRAGWDHVSH